ncbi:MAG: hypothetical protein ACE5KZ_10695 [Candidatus Scalinduaceae bacterium]
MKSINRFRKLNFIRIIPILLIFLLVTSNAWAANGAETGAIVGTIVGAIIGVIVMFRIHPVLGILTLIGALAYIGRMLSN